MPSYDYKNSFDIVDSQRLPGITETRGELLA